MKKISELQKIAFFGLAAKAVKPMFNLLKYHLIDSGVQGVIEGATTEGDSKQKVRSGVETTLKRMVDPRAALTNIFGYNLIPALGAKAMGSAGLTMLKKNPKSLVGKMLSKQDLAIKDSFKNINKKSPDMYSQLTKNLKETKKNRSFISDYFGGQRSGMATDLLIGSTISPKILAPVFGSDEQHEAARQKFENYPIII